MSFDIFLQGFRDGETSNGDGNAALSVLESLIVSRGDTWAQIETEDGAAAVYGLDRPAAGFMVNHASGRRVWDVIFDLAREAGFVVLPVGCPTCVLVADRISDLPPELATDAVVVRTGDDILGIIENA